MVEMVGETTVATIKWMPEECAGANVAIYYRS